MSNVQHTPRPWKIEGSALVNCICAVAQEGYEVQIGKVNRWRDSPEEAEANARLIAAAPELLNACEEALGALNGAEHALPAYAVQALERAIAKATGSAS